MLTPQLHNHINTHGPLRLDHFLEKVLYDPQHGYYAKCIPIGKDGDYITAPEISQVFGELVGLWVINSWQQAGMPTPFHLIEMGPGLGTLMADMLRTFKLTPSLLENVHIHLVEISPLLKQQQQQKLAAYQSITWHETLATVPPGFSIIIGNEFFDALPIRQFIHINSQWFERFVSTHKDGFEFINLESAPPKNSPLPLANGILTEQYDSAQIIVQELSQRLNQYGGFGLFIDYGEEVPYWQGNTLQALHRHQKQEVFTNIGFSDITHHVDFFRLKEIFKSHYLNTYGTVTQRQFLNNLGLETRVNRLAGKLMPLERLRLNMAILRLIGCQEMGELFKVLVIAANNTLAPAGFDDTCY